MGWKIEDNFLVKEFECGNFVEAVDFVNNIANLAEKANHHPDILIHSYKYVTVKLRSHAQNSITDKDYSLANHIDELK